MGRNPATGEAIRIKASKKARITPVKAFKDAVLAPAKAPKLKKGAFPTEEAAVAAAGKSVRAGGREGAGPDGGEESARQEIHRGAQSARQEVHHGAPGARQEGRKEVGRRKGANHWRTGRSRSHITIGCRRAIPLIHRSSGRMTTPCESGPTRISIHAPDWWC